MKSNVKKRKSPRKNNKAKASNHSLSLMIGGACAVVLLLSFLGFAMIPFSAKKGSESVWVYVPEKATSSSVKDSLKANLGSSMGSRVYILWKLMGGSASQSHGAYLVEDGQSALRIARNVAGARQTPIKVTFTGARTLTELSAKIAKQFEFSDGNFYDACMEILPDSGYNTHTFPAAFIPDTYEFYWSSTPGSVVKRLLEYRNRFWNDERKQKLERVGLTKVQVATLASIIEEETAKSDERPKVARLYLNRLDHGMRLQADPTVKFAVGDPTIRRITGAHLKVASPYNTYLNKGLPPGPIRIPSAKAMDDVLNASQHEYLYMCAREDFSGYHNFAVDYATHSANAKRYQAALDKRNIH